MPEWLAGQEAWPSGSGKSGGRLIRDAPAHGGHWGLLRRRLKLKPRPRPGKGGLNSKYFAFGDDGEAALSAWIEEHALYACLEVNVDEWPGVYRVEDVETALIERLEPPLNLTKSRNPEKAGLSTARKSAERASLKWAIRDRRKAQREARDAEA